MTQHKDFRDHITNLLKGRGAHVPFEKVVVNFPAEKRGALVPGLPQSAWQILEHMRIAQWDIVEYCKDPSHNSPNWPDEYWPQSTEPLNDNAWSFCIDNFGNDLQTMIEMVQNPENDLVAPMPNTPGHTLLRGALLIADHNAYHLGQLVFIRRALGIW
ncbi:MAG: DinB family protein [Aliifodinibius sp.]|nr:DinB family protein [Fodinibius sp.]